MQNEAIIVGSGPNGLAAGITLASAGVKVVIFEASAEIGGGARSAELTLPSFLHDTCSAVHPLAVASPFFRSLPLEDLGLDWIFPPVPVAHPLEGGRSVSLKNDLAEMRIELGADGDVYRSLFQPWVDDADRLFETLLGPLRYPKAPEILSSFGIRALLSAKAFVNLKFKTPGARALFGGLAAHSFLPMDSLTSSAIGLVLAISGHAYGWPIPAGGSCQISSTLAAHFSSLGGTIVTNRLISTIEELPNDRLILFDVSPRALASICQSRFPSAYLKKLLRFRLAPGVFKMDFALSSPVPWEDPNCGRSATVHLGGSFEEISHSEQEVHEGNPPKNPFVLVAQPSLFDERRAPPERHVLWAYCHVPNGSTFDMSDRIESQIERFAPGFRDTILAKHVMFPADIEKRNANCIGGDICGGLTNWRQLFARPVSIFHPYRTPSPNIFICSASTPPGAGIHGMCGHFAALDALKTLRNPP